MSAGSRLLENFSAVESRLEYAARYNAVPPRVTGSIATVRPMRREPGDQGADHGLDDRSALVDIRRRARAGQILPARRLGRDPIRR